MIDYQEAVSLVLSATKTLPAEFVSLAEALGRTLARDIRAQEDIPPFDKATMDGYAVRAADTRPDAGNAAIELEVTEDLPAGRTTRRAVGPGQAVRIMTGAPMPKGADAVVMVEDTEKSGSRVKVRREVRPGDNTGKAGEDLRKGELVLERGSTVGPAETGMLAAAGLARVPVVRRPKLAILSTGTRSSNPERRKAPAGSGIPTAPPSRPWPAARARRRNTWASPGTGIDL